MYSMCVDSARITRPVHHKTRVRLFARCCATAVCYMSGTLTFDLQQRPIQHAARNYTTRARLKELPVELDLLQSRHLSCFT